MHNILRDFSMFHMKFEKQCRAVARSENLGGLVVLGGDNVPPLVEIGLTDLPKTGWGERAQYFCSH